MSYGCSQTADDLSGETSQGFGATSQVNFFSGGHLQKPSKTPFPESITRAYPL